MATMKPLVKHYGSLCEPALFGRRVFGKALVKPGGHASGLSHSDQSGGHMSVSWIARTAIALLLVALLYGVIHEDTHAQPSPMITVSPAGGPAGTAVTVRGTGFAPGDTVLVEMIGPSGETGRLATVTVNPDGSFSASATIPAGSPPERLPIMAYPASFGPRSRDTLDAAPKATFQIGAPNRLPTTGKGLAFDAQPNHASLVLLALVVGVGGSLVMLRRLPRSRT